MLDEGAANKKVAEVLRCSKRHPRVLNDRDIRRLERIVKKYPKIEYLLLMKEAGLWDEEAA
ncbi:hypothetical protein GQ44DRAFT_715186, partial [Phaeosphaeriaceae sp. PMI808]